MPRPCSPHFSLLHLWLSISSRDFSVMSLSLVFSYIVPFINVSGSVKHSLKQEKNQNDEKANNLDCTKPVQRHGSCSKTLCFVLSWDILPVDQSQNDDTQQSEEDLCEVIFARLHFFILMRDVWMVLPLATVQILLTLVHVLWQHFSVKVGDLVEELLHMVPGLFVPSWLLVNEHLVMLVYKQVHTLVPVARIQVIWSNALVVNVEAWVLVNVVLGLDIVPGSNLGQILLVK